jgi:hypothetical protein
MNFKNTLNLLLIPILIMSVQCSLEKKQREQVQKMGEIVKDQVMKPMMARVIEKVEAEGAGDAIKYCSWFAEDFIEEKTNELARKFSLEYNITEMRIRRVSLRNRNEKNFPDEEERKTIKDWMKSEQGSLNNKAQAQVLKKDGYYHYLAPIRIVSSVCLQCHGKQDTMDKMVNAEIQKKYPNDNAKNYEMNELRGAFSVRVKF